MVCFKMKIYRNFWEFAHQINTTTFLYFQVGDAMIRGVSGGERKRTCIGIELIIAQQIIFLDEPTTGLDSTTAGSVMRLLHK